MDTSSLRKEESRSGPRVLARHRPRRLEMPGLLIGLAVGVILVLTLSPFGGHGPGTPHQAKAGRTVLKHAIGPIPAALDAEWAAYSDRSTCADWAGGGRPFPRPRSAPQRAPVFLGHDPC